MMKKRAAKHQKCIDPHPPFKEHLTSWYRLTGRYSRSQHIGYWLFLLVASAPHPFFKPECRPTAHSMADTVHRSSGCCGEVEITTFNRQQNGAESFRHIVVLRVKNLPNFYQFLVFQNVLYKWQPNKIVSAKMFFLSGFFWVPKKNLVETAGAAQFLRYFRCPPEHGIFVRPPMVSWKEFLDLEAKQSLDRLVIVID